MATQFVRLGRDLSRLRFAGPAARGWAAAIDAVVVTAPAFALWAYLAFALPGSVDSILLGLPFNLAIFAYIAYAVLYFVVCDALFGATLGKSLLRLSVTDRHWARPTILQSFLRETPKAVSFYILGQFGGPAILFLARSSSTPLSALGVSLAFTGAVLLGLAVIGLLITVAVGGAEVSRDSERQRLGDRWASTWVIDRRQVIPAWGATRAPPDVPPGAVPPG